MGGVVSAVVSVVSKVAGFGGFNPLGFAISMIASAVLSKIFAPNPPKMSGGGALQDAPNPGQRQQLPPAGDNKLPIIYGSAWVGGVVIDMSISSNNQDIYWVIALSEVTNTDPNSIGGPDAITFGDVYWGGKKCVFAPNGYLVSYLLDESTGQIQDIYGKMHVYLYSNGSYSPANGGPNAISVMSESNLTYKWDSNKLMSNCAFAIIHITYSQSKNLTGLNQTRFKVINSRTKPADCIYDYMVSNRYGAAIPPANIDATSFANLNNYSDQTITYYPYSGGTEILTRYRFDGTLDTNQKIMNNLQAMSDSCNCLLRYNEITGKWGIITQSPNYTVSMDLNDSNIISALTVSPIDISNSFNIIECKFPDGTNKDSFSTANFDLAQIDPALLYPNEPVNKQSVNLYLVNNNVRAQYIANIMLKAAREDLQVTCEINYVGLQLEAGDIVTLTNANYGWTAKLFRILKVTQKFDDSGSVTAQLLLSEFNPSVYDDVTVTQFTPAPNTGIGSPVTFGTILAPTFINVLPSAANPNFSVQVQTSSNGITQYAEIWYSAYPNPSASQRIFAGTTAVQSNGDPYDVNTIIEAVPFYNIPAGNWYFFSRMVNGIASSDFSPASDALNWKPTSLNFSDRYVSVAYADDEIGTGFNLNPRNKSYFGLLNQTSNSPALTASSYKWYPANPTFGTSIFLLFTKRANRNFSFDTGFAGYAGGTASFVPTQIAVFDPTIWSGLPDGTNIIDLDQRTGQLIGTGTTTVGTGEIAIVNNPNGTIVASLQQYLDFGGPYTKTVSPALITIDIYGRIVGFATPDDFYYSENNFVATAGQTVFNVTRGSGYIPYQCLVFRNGLLLQVSEYTDNTTNITLNTGCLLDDTIEIIAFKSVNATSGVYASFTRNSVTLSNQISYTSSGFTLTNGYELLFLNGAIVSAADYFITGQTISFNGNTTGELEIIQWTPNNLGVANGTPVNADAYTIQGQTTYNFTFNPSAFNLYSNGILLINTLDYNESTNQYSLTVAPVNNDTIMVQQTFSRTGAV